MSRPTFNNPKYKVGLNDVIEIDGFKATGAEIIEAFVENDILHAELDNMEVIDHE